MLCHTNKSKINYRKIQKCMTWEYLGETKFLYKEYSLKFNLTFRLTRKVISPPWYRREWSRGGGGGGGWWNSSLEFLISCSISKIFYLQKRVQPDLLSHNNFCQTFLTQLNTEFWSLKMEWFFFFVFKNLFSFSRLNRFLFLGVFKCQVSAYWFLNH